MTFELRLNIAISCAEISRHPAEDLTLKRAKARAPERGIHAASTVVVLGMSKILCASNSRRGSEMRGGLRLPPPHVGGYAYLLMNKIIISELEVFYRVGVPDAERAKPQRLLISVEMARDFAAAATADDLTKTIDYDAVTRRLLKFGEGRSWKLMEKLAADLAEMILAQFAPGTVCVEVRKFIVPEARYVAVQLTRTAADASAERS